MINDKSDLFENQYKISFFSIHSWYMQGVSSGLQPAITLEALKKVTLRKTRSAKHIDVKTTSTTTPEVNNDSG